MIHIVPTAIIGLVAAVGFPWPVVAGDAPAWRQPLPGTAAILGDDGGGEDQATVCDTAALARNARCAISRRGRRLCSIPPWPLRCHRRCRVRPRQRYDPIHHDGAAAGKHPHPGQTGPGLRADARRHPSGDSAGHARSSEGRRQQQDSACSSPGRRDGRRPGPRRAGNREVAAI